MDPTPPTARRQREICRLYIQNFTREEIAIACHCSIWHIHNTVRFQKDWILHLQAISDRQACNLAARVAVLSSLPEDVKQLLLALNTQADDTKE